MSDIKNQKITPETLKREELELLNSSPNNFPYWVFPEPLREIVEETNKCLQFPIEYIAASILFVCGAANGKTHAVRFAESYETYSSLWISIIGVSGYNKTTPIKWALKPIKQRELENYEQFERELTNHRESNSDSPEPVCKKFLMSDFTIEALARNHKENSRGICVHVDELKGWLGNMNRYNSGSDMEIYLQIHSNGDLLVDRANGTRFYVPNAFIPIIGGIQPERLKYFISKEQKSSGFTQRFLFTEPVYYHKEKWTDEKLPSHIEQNYKNIINNILDWEYNHETSFIRYETDARELVVQYINELSVRWNSDDTEFFRGVYSKFQVNIHRFSLICQVMTDACKNIRPNIISIENVKNAIALSEYFLNQFHKVYRNEQKETILNNDSKKVFFKSLPDDSEFTTAIAFKIGDELNIGRKTIQRLLKDLLEIGYLNKIGHGTYNKSNPY